MGCGVALYVLWFGVMWGVLGCWPPDLWRGDIEVSSIVTADGQEFKITQRAGIDYSRQLWYRKKGAPWVGIARLCADDPRAIKASMTYDAVADVLSFGIHIKDSSYPRGVRVLEYNAEMDGTHAGKFVKLK